MLSLLMLLLAIMTSVTATGGNKQSAQTTVSSYRKLYINFFQGRSMRFCSCTYAGKKSCSAKGGPLQGDLGACYPRFFKIQGLGNATSIVFCRIFSVNLYLGKCNQLCSFPISSVVGKVQCLREKRPVTSSELWDNKMINEILTQRHQSVVAKNVLFTPNLVPRAFPLKNGWGGKRPWHRLVTCPLVHPKILGVINQRYVK